MSFSTGKKRPRPLFTLPKKPTGLGGLLSQIESFDSHDANGPDGEHTRVPDVR